MAIKLLPKISRNLPCDVATLQGLLDNASELLENQQKGINGVWAADHIHPFLRWGGFLDFDGSSSVTVPDKYRMHPREEFSLIFKNFTKEHVDGGFWLVLGQTTSAATLCISMEEPFADNPGEVLFKISDGTSIETALSAGLDLRHHDIVELGVVYNGTSISFYKDGALINTVATTVSPLNYTGQMFIGGDHAGANEVSGYLRDWYFWGKEFSAGEMATYFSDHIDPYPDELRIALSFDEAAGTTIGDSADPDKWGIEFDDLTQTPIYHQDELICIDNFTILGECYWHENSHSENVIMAKGSQFEGHCNYRIAVEKSTKKLKFSYYNGVVWTHVVSNLTVRAGHYCDFGVRVSGSTIEFYIDGAWDTQTLPISLRSNYHSLTFGYDLSIFSPTNRWHGHLRNIGIIPEVMSDGDVTTFFTSGYTSATSCYWALRNGVGNTFESSIEHDANDFSSGTDSYIPPDVMQQIPVEGTFFVQLYPKNLAAISSNADVFSKTDGATIDYQLQIDSSSRIVFRTKGPSVNNVVSGLTLGDNRWFEILVTIRRANVSIYSNGSTWNAIISDLIRTVSTGQIAIGVSAEDPFPGFIKKYKQWDRCLRYEEVDKMLYERIFPTSGLVVDCPMNEGSGSIFNDNSDEYRLDI